MDLKQLSYFVHVAELGSFTKASSLLSMAQSALSAQVRRLELELNLELLHRDGRGVTPTAAGRCLLGHARGILLQVDRAREELSRTRGAPVGHLVIGLPVSIARLLTVTLIESFQARLPQASFGVMEGLSASVTEWVVGGRVDIGMVYNAAPSPQLEIQPLCDQEMVLIARSPGGDAPRSRVVTTRELADCPLILPRPPNANRLLIEGHLARQGLVPRIAFEIDGIESILDLVHAGYGCAILPRTSLRAHRKARDFVASRIVGPALRAQISLITAAHRPVTPLVREALRLVHDEVPRALAASR